MRNTFHWAISRAWIWASLYIVTIPVAAGVFALNAKGFYDTNLAREPGTAHDEARLAQQLTATIDRNASQARLTYRNQKVSLLVSPRVVQVVRGQGAIGTLAIELYAVVGIGADGPIRSEAGGPVWFEIGPQEGSTQVGNSPPVYLYDVQPVGAYGIGTETISGPLALLVHAAFPSQQRGYAPSLSLPQAAATEFENVVGAYQGNPAAASGLYLRMLYASATTITTLGLGDVQPVSPAARTWLSAEAVAGVLFAGFFLNAVARQGRRDS